MFGVYLDLARRSPRREETPWMHLAMALYLGGAITYFALYPAKGSRFEPDGIAVADLLLTMRGVGLLLFAGVMAVVLNRRSARVQREQQHLAQEMRAGTEMQALMLPAGAIQVPGAPGFEMESAYLPAQQVGGDFFQVLSAANGGALVVVGDVSGKGLRAAIVASLVIGALRSRRSDEPGVVLADRNNALAEQIGGGFVTSMEMNRSPLPMPDILRRTATGTNGRSSLGYRWEWLRGWSMRSPSCVGSGSRLCPTGWWRRRTRRASCSGLSARVRSAGSQRTRSPMPPRRGARTKFFPSVG